MFRTDLTATDIQRKIFNEWHTCYELYEKGFDHLHYTDSELRTRLTERAFSYARGIGEMLTDNEWNKVFTDEFNKLWSEVRDAFFIPRDEICESEFKIKGLSDEAIKILEYGVE